MKYCKECLLPSTKPYILFNEEGVCGACLAHKKKNQKNQTDTINWNARSLEFESLMERVKAQKAPFYDVLVPVSGGKDSITQVHRLLGRNLRILAVNVDYGIKTEVGHFNLNLIPQMGASLIIFRPDMTLQSKLIRLGFEDYGDPDLLSHTLLYAYPLHAAMNYKIPLVCLGENSAFEYSGEEKAEKSQASREWFLKYVANAGNEAQVIGQKYGISSEDLKFYTLPNDFFESKTQAVFLSYFFHWDSEEHLKIAKQYGFRTLSKPSEGTYRNYVGIDEKINRIHQYMKLLKFGYGRATDHACEDIRNGRLSREEAKALVKQHDLHSLSDYYIEDFLKLTGLSRTKFIQTLEKYRNLSLWKKDSQGAWFIPGHLEDQTAVLAS